MNRIEKFLATLDIARRIEAERLIMRIVSSDFNHMDIKKLKGREGEYRVRAGRMRIRFVHSSIGNRILSIGWRDSDTY